MYYATGEGLGMYYDSGRGLENVESSLLDLMDENELKKVFIITESHNGKQIVYQDNETGFTHIYTTLDEAEIAMRFIKRDTAGLNILRFTNGERG